jgi:hypothetical protein
LFLTSTTGGAVLSSPASTSPLQIWSY